MAFMTTAMTFFNAMRSPEILLVAVVVVAIGRTLAGYWKAYVVATVALIGALAFARPDLTLQQAIFCAGALLLLSGIGAIVRSEVVRHL